MDSPVYFRMNGWVGYVIDKMGQDNDCRLVCWCILFVLYTSGHLSEFMDRRSVSLCRELLSMVCHLAALCEVVG
jgi:hypothetical protein